MGSPHHRSRGFGPATDRSFWEIGLVDLPATVPGEDGIPFQPLVAVVMDASGAVRAMAPGHPDRPVEALEKAILQAREFPCAPCEPGEPRRVVVDSDRLLLLVPRLLPEALVITGPTPRLAKASQSLREHARASSNQPGQKVQIPTYLTNDVVPEVARGFFEAAAALYERQPWRRIPSDGHLFRVTCLPLGVRSWIGCVIGQRGESYGVILFDSLEDYERYLEVAERVEAGEEKAMENSPSYRAINFEPKSAMPKELLREIDHYHWPVAAADAFPTVMLVKQDLELLPPRQKDFFQFELVARALCEWLDVEPEPASLWQQATPPSRRRFRVPVGRMKLPVLIGVAQAHGKPKASREQPVNSAVDSAPLPHPSAKPPPKVPAALRERVDSLMDRIDPFCARHLTSEYRELIFAAVAALARKRPSPLLTGRETSWCAGVVHAIGVANFLFDPSQTPHCSPNTVYDFFGVSASTGQNHSRKVRQMLDIGPFAPNWTLPHLLEESAMPWMLEVNGVLLDVRTLPLEIQQQAFAKGFIPYVPALRNRAREV